VFEAGYGNNAIPEGRNMMVTYITGLWIIQQCRNRWLAQREGSLSWDEIVQVSEQCGPSRAFIDVDDPVFGCPQADMPATVREACVQTGQGRLESMGEIARCLYESLVLKYRRNVECLEKITGHRLEFIHIMGGGIQNKTLCQWIADATGIPVMAGPTETTSMGNLLMQLKADGEIVSLEEGREISLRSSQVDFYEPSGKKWWDDTYGKYRELFRKK
ncbi:MAG TPA: FGGY-family carbohydrate kinase, partial [Atribacteraceae bacterium]|nr:FGGY-family carbohydrate kinase [Atribacteraceae bacterium]